MFTDTDTLRCLPSFAWPWIGYSFDARHGRSLRLGKCAAVAGEVSLIKELAPGFALRITGSCRWRNELRYERRKVFTGIVEGSFGGDFWWELSGLPRSTICFHDAYRQDQFTQLFRSGAGRFSRSEFGAFIHGVASDTFRPRLQVIYVATRHVLMARILVNFSAPTGSLTCFCGV